jgi:hypothetical protein
MQDHALCRKFLLDRTRHVPSPFELTSPTKISSGRFVSRIARLHASDGGSVAKCRKTWHLDG